MTAGAGPSGDDLEGLAWRLKTLLHNGKKTPWDSGEQRRYYQLVVSKLLDPDAPAMPPGMRAPNQAALLARLDEIEATENAGNPHVYLSTSCHHDLHDRCSADTAIDAGGHRFARRPAQCKFCQAACVCPCHGGMGMEEGRRTTTWGEPCPHCGKRGAWSSLDPSALYVPPSGHTVRRLPEGVSYETCPQEPSPPIAE